MGQGIILSTFDQQMVDLWNANYSGTRIAAMLGISRHSVLGRIHRLRARGYSPLRSSDTTKPKPVQKERKIAMPSVPVTRPQTAPARVQPLPRLEKVLVESLNVTIHELMRDSCRFINTDVRGADNVKYCGLTRIGPESSYCQDHSRLCYVPPRDRNRRIKEMLS